jgi:hypothetical protein
MYTENVLNLAVELATKFTPEDWKELHSVIDRSKAGQLSDDDLISHFGNLVEKRSKDIKNN